MDLGLKPDGGVNGRQQGHRAAAGAQPGRRGARVLIASREERPRRAARDNERPNGPARGDGAGGPLDTGGVRALSAEALRRLGRIDILVNNAGAIKGGDFLTTPDEEWLRGWSLKLLGYIRMARETLPHMQRQGSGRIINVVGAAGRNPATTYMMGGTANAALINFTKALSDLAAKDGILVTGVSPGPVKTERWDSLLRQQAEAAGQDVFTFEKARSAELPLGRIALPEEVADLICFLASARATFLTGITITVDGGITRGVYL